MITFSNHTSLWQMLLVDCLKDVGSMLLFNEGTTSFHIYSLFFSFYRGFLHSLQKHRGIDPLGCANYLVHPFAHWTFQIVSSVNLFYLVEAIRERSGLLVERPLL